MNIDTQELDHLRFAFNCLSSGNFQSQGRTQDDCCQASEVWEAAGGELSSRATRSLIDHLAQCPQCAESWRLAREIRIEMGGAVGGRRPDWFSWGLPRRAAGLAIAATMLLASGLYLWDPFDRSAPPRMRGNVPSALQFSGSEDSPLQRSHCQLSWAVPGADSADSGIRYHVQVMTLDLDPVDSAHDLTVPEYTIPSDRLSQLPSGTILVWHVEAVDDQGRRISGDFVSRLQ